MPGEGVAMHRVCRPGRRLGALERRCPGGEPACGIVNGGALYSRALQQPDLQDGGTCRARMNVQATQQSVSGNAAGAIAWELGCG